MAPFRACAQAGVTPREYSTTIRMIPATENRAHRMSRMSWCVLEGMAVK
ncbi:hypothetical protein PVA48_02805 [Akkermansia sp. JRP_AM1]